MGPSFRIVIRSGPTPGKVFPLEKNEIFIGRDLSNDVIINDPEISRRHSRLFLQNGSYMLEDLGSTNGTSVNGQRLMGPYMIHPGEIVTLGERISLIFEAVQAEGDATVSASSAQAEKVAPVPTVQPSYYPSAYGPSAYENPGMPQVRPATPPPPTGQLISQAPAPQPYQPPVNPAPQNPYPAAQPVYIPPAAQPQYQPAPQPVYDPNQAAFAGQVPIAPGMEPTEARAKLPVWPFIIIGVLLLIILVLVIDDFRLWCPIFGICS